MPRPSALHRLVQILFALLIVWAGSQFILYSLWAMGLSDAYHHRPPSVEAFLPISAMMALKRLILTGQWDPVHPAGLCILIMALFTSLLLRKAFCGYLCPLGALSFRLFQLGKKLGISCSVPKKISWLLTLPKYLLLAFFINITLLSFDLSGTEAFLFSRYNMVADTKMLLFFAHPSPALLGFLGFLLAGSLVIPSFWCRCFCPYGALLGILSLFSPLAVRRDASACLNCGKCSAACPQGIAVDRSLRVFSPECTGCQECTAACPKKGCLSMEGGYGFIKRRLPSWFVPSAVVLAVAAMYAAACLSGHWESSVPPQMQRQMHHGIETLRHY